MHYRSIFISDVHLGTRGCQAEKLAEFLKYNTCENLFLVGDILDFWSMKNWNQQHTNVVRRILTKAKRGTQVIYILGNHDEVLRKYLDTRKNRTVCCGAVKGRYTEFGNIIVCNHFKYETIKGEQFLVTHGDLFDAFMRGNLKYLAFIGDYTYRTLIKLNTLVNKYRAFRGKPYWSLSKYLKGKTKKALNYITQFEVLMMEYAYRKDYDGVICGHIHTPENRHDYKNCGDWVESCTALVETVDGQWKLLS